MTLEQKIEHLKDAAMQEARAEGNAIMKQHEDALEGVSAPPVGDPDKSRRH